jgi:hypothetical protein
VTAAILVAAIVGASLGNNILARQYTPEGAVSQYLTALQSGSSSEAWSVIQVSAPTQPLAAALIDQAALRAAVAGVKPDIKSFTLTGTSTRESDSIVKFSYDTAGGTKQAEFTVQRSGQTQFGLYPVWHLVISPTLLSITLPKGANGVSVDGKAIALPSGPSTMAVLPVMHKVQVNGTQVFAAQTVMVDSSSHQRRRLLINPRLPKPQWTKPKPQ